MNQYFLQVLRQFLLILAEHLHNSLDNSLSIGVALQQLQKVNHFLSHYGSVLVTPYFESFFSSVYQETVSKEAGSDYKHAGEELWVFLA